MNHIWGDNWPYWDELYAAQIYIQRYVERRSGCYMLMKEKYGTIRYEHMIPPSTSPYFLRWRKFYRIEQWWNQCYFIRLWKRYAYWLAKRAIFKILKQKPYLSHELLEDAVSDHRFRFPKYWEKLLGWKSSTDWDWNKKEEDDEI